MNDDTFYEHAFYLFIYLFTIFINLFITFINLIRILYF